MKWITIAALILLIPGPALGQMICNPREEVLEYLEKKYKEVVVAGGVTSRGGLIEVLSEVGGGTWTIIISTPQGISCLVASGEGWRSLKNELKEGERL